MSEMESRCPGCGHMHPNGIGLWMCGCWDCSLWFGPIPYESLGEKARARRDELARLNAEGKFAR